MPVITHANAKGEYSVPSAPNVVVPKGQVTATPSAHGVNGHEGQGQYTPKPVVITTATPDNAGKVTITGTASPDATVKVLFPGDATPVTVHAKPDGSYTATSANNLVPSGTIKATENTDPTAPPATKPYSESKTSATVTKVTANSDGSVTVTGTATPFAKVTVLVPGATVPVITHANAKGDYSVPSAPKVVVPSGPVTAMPSANGVNGHEGQGKYTEAAPEISITKVEMNPDGSIKVIGKATPGSAVSVKMPNGTTVPATASATGTYTVNSAPGVAMVGGNVTATTSIHNLNGTAKPVGYTAPAVTINKNGITLDADGQVSVSGTATPNATVTVLLPGSTTPVKVKADGQGHYIATTVGNKIPSGPVTATENTNPAVAKGEYTAPKSTDTSGGKKASGTIINNGGVPTIPLHGLTPGKPYVIHFPGGHSKTVIAGPDGTITIHGDASLPNGNITVTGPNDQIVGNWVWNQNISAGTITYGLPNDRSNRPEVVVVGATPKSHLTVLLPSGEVLHGVADAQGNYRFPESSEAQSKGKITVTASLPGQSGSSSAQTPFTPQASVTIIRGMYYNKAGQENFDLQATPFSVITVPYETSDGKEITQTLHVGASGLVTFTASHVFEHGKIRSYIMTDNAQGATAKTEWLAIPLALYNNINVASIQTVNPGNNKPVVSLALTTATNRGSDSSASILPVGAQVKVEFPDKTFVSGTITAADIAQGKITFPESKTPQFAGPITVSVNTNGVAPAQGSWMPKAIIGKVVVDNSGNNIPKVTITGNIPGTTMQVTFPGESKPQSMIVPVGGEVTFTAKGALSQTADIKIVDSMGIISTEKDETFQPLYIPSGGDSGKGGHSQKKETIQVSNSGNNLPVVTLSNVAPNTKVIVTFPSGETEPGVADKYGNVTVTAKTVQVISKDITATDDKGTLDKPYKPVCITGQGHFNVNEGTFSHPAFDISGASSGTTMNAVITYDDGTTQDVSGVVSAQGTFSIPSNKYTDLSVVKTISYQATAGNLSGSKPTATYTHDVPLTVTDVNQSWYNGSYQPIKNRAVIRVSGMLPGTLVHVHFPNGEDFGPKAVSNGDLIISKGTCGTGKIIVTATYQGDTGSEHKVSYAPVHPEIDYLGAHPNANHDPIVTFSGIYGSHIVVHYPNDTTESTTVPLDGHVTMPAPTGVMPTGPITVTASLPGVPDVKTSTNWQGQTVSMGISSVANNDHQNKPLVQLVGATRGATIVLTFPDQTHSKKMVVTGDITTLPQPDFPQKEGNIIVTLTLGDQHIEKKIEFVPQTVIGGISIKNNNNKPTVTITGASPDSTVTVKFPSGEIEPGHVDMNGQVKVTAKDVQTVGWITVTDSVGDVVGQPKTVKYAPSVGLGSLDVKPNLQNEPQVIITGASPYTEITVTFPDGTTVVHGKTDVHGDVTMPKPSMPQKMGPIVIKGVLGEHSLSKSVDFSPISYIGNATVKIVGGKPVVTIVGAAPKSIIKVQYAGTDSNSSQTAETDIHGDVVIRSSEVQSQGNITISDNAGSLTGSTAETIEIKDGKGRATQIPKATKKHDSSDVKLAVNNENQGLFSRFVQWFKK